MTAEDSGYATRTEGSRGNSWIIGLLFGLLLALVMVVTGFLALGLEPELIAGTLVLIEFIAIIMIAGGVAGRRNASGLRTGAVAGAIGVLPIALGVFLILGSTLGLMEAAGKAEGSEGFVLAITLLILIVAALLGAGLGWIGARMMAAGTADSGRGHSSNCSRPHHNT